MAFIQDIDDLKNYVEVNQNIDYSTISPSIAIAERRYIKTLLGPDQYQQLVSFVPADPQNLTNTDKVIFGLIAIIKEAEANIAIMLAVPRLSVTVSDNGIKRNETNDSKTAFQYQEINLQESYANAGFDALEDMLEYLEDNKAIFTTWLNSDSYTNQKRFIISSARQFSRYYEIYRIRQTYLAVRYVMQRIETFTLRPIIGDTFFNVLKAGLKAGNLALAYQDLIDNYIGPGIALMAIAKALIERAVDISDKGVTVSITAPDHNRPSRESAPDSKVLAMVDQMQADATQFFDGLGKELIANPQLYPDYVAPAAPVPYVTITNDCKNSFFAL